MPYIPQRVTFGPLGVKLFNALGPARQGKVRDTYSIPGYPETLLVVATDRISIFDFVLGAFVRDKGAILTAMTIFWLSQILTDWQHHMLAYGSGIDSYLPQKLRSNPELQSRALVVRKLEMIPVECIVREYLTGSGWSSYQETGAVCGHTLATGLHDGSKLSSPIFTPTTKSEVGHDESLQASDVVKKYGQELATISKHVFRLASSYALERGIIIADTKFELGRRANDPANLHYVLADEVLTPDSSRFWRVQDWAEAAALQKSPQGHDKEPVRAWGKSLDLPDSRKGIHKLNPAIMADQQLVGQIQVPGEVTEATTDRYHSIFQMLSDMTLKEFQHFQMHIV
jgi:phosphoribosylaminoimidazole-succinocarboxamide synthase